VAEVLFASRACSADHPNQSRQFSSS